MSTEIIPQTPGELIDHIGLMVCLCRSLVKAIYGIEDEELKDDIAHQIDINLENVKTTISTLISAPSIKGVL